MPQLHGQNADADAQHGACSWAELDTHACDEKKLRNKDQFKDRNAILALFRTKLEVFQEAVEAG